MVTNIRLANLLAKEVSIARDFTFRACYFRQSVEGVIFVRNDRRCGGVNLRGSSENVACKPTDHVGCREVKVIGGILREESRELFRKFCESFPVGGYASWAKTLF